MVKEYRLHLDIEDLIQESRNQENRGPKLAKVHTELGNIIGEDLSSKICEKKEGTTIITIMRAGLFFAQGIWECIPTAQFLPIRNVEELDKYDIYLQNRNIIIADSVINTGKSVQPIIEALKSKENNIFVATIVINDKAVPKFEEDGLHTIRISANSYVGTKSIDTGNRLFNTVELA